MVLVIGRAASQSRRIVSRQRRVSRAMSTLEALRVHSDRTGLPGYKRLVLVGGPADYLLTDS